MSEVARNYLFRYESDSQGTFGKLIYGNCALNSLEPPWKDNKRNLSCIPAAEYLCTWHCSPQFGWVYIINDVPDRDHILMHPGNFAGDIECGYETDSEGCVLCAKSVGELVINNNRQKAILNSRVGIQHFFQRMNQQPFHLKILNVF